MTKTTLSLRTRIGFSFGHIFMDLSGGSFWFAYSLLVFKLHLPPSHAGLLLSLGQGCDAITTLLVGYLSTMQGCFISKKYGQLKFYHLIGTIMLFIGFPLTYNKCFVCDANTSHMMQFAYYMFVVIIFQMGCSFAQVSHVGLISKLSANSADRVILTAYRQAATVSASITMYATTFIMLKLRGSSSQITAQDYDTFSFITLILWAIGVISSMLFHLLVKEERGVVVQNGDDGKIDDLQIKIQRPWKEWLRDSVFYRILILYVIGHLYYVIMQIYIPMLLQHTLRSPKESVAMVPFVTYTVGFLVSFAFKPIATRLGSKAVLLIGCNFGLAFALWIYLADDSFGQSWQVYGATALNGIAGTCFLISIVSLISKLTKDYPDSGAFVFGVMSFTDKLVNGTSIFLLEMLLPVPSAHGRNGFYSKAIVSVTCACILVLVLITFSLLNGWGDCYTPSCVYETAVLNTGIVGREVGLLLHLLVSYDKISHDKLHLIGFSLGSHVTHYAANWFTIMQLSPNSNCGLLKVGRITGLDPASRQFEDSPGSYINKDDAMFVDIVHTSATLSNGSAKDVAAARFGIAYAVGHLDWYMNGGRKQPSCSSSSFQCHHQKAYQFYEHVLGDHVDHLSLAGSNCDCHEKLSTCRFLDYNNLSIFGIDDIRYPARGIVYLDWDFLMPAKADTKNDASAPPAVCNVKYTEAPQVSNDLIDFYVKECLNAD
ncbi:Major facilitator superfamily domain-containing protein 12 [Halotydeus destructor]|nr:Major facilitator superfamily domain-containing protein 12 [Halotydeus destructor]